MLFKVDPRIFKEFPGTMIGIVVAHGITNKKEDPRVKALLEKTQARLNKLIKKEEIKEHPHIAIWYEAYKKIGTQSKEMRSSFENLIIRVINGKPFESINTLVDLYNIVSLRYLLPVGGEDLDKVKGNIELTFAEENEKPVVLFGEKEAQTPQLAEVIYKDTNGALSRSWNWREADRTKLTLQTTNALLMIEGLAPIAPDYIEKATHELAILIERYCGGRTSIALITQEYSSIAIKKGNHYIPLLEKKSIDVSDEPKHMAVLANEQHTAHSEEYENRVRKLHAMQQANIPAWPEYKEVTTTIKNILDTFTEDAPSEVYEVAGRLMTLRKHGKTAFAHIQDRTGSIQIYIRQDIIGDKLYQIFDDFFDIGDIVWAKGIVFRTKMGEITIKVQELQIISKCLHPLPEKFHGLADIETKYRQRYLDLISNKESRERFYTRSRIIKAMRNFLDDHDFIEVETPMLHALPGGAVARPFITHHNTLNMDLYLRIAPELYLKRLVIGGVERVYEINRCFRNEGISTKHNPEFTTIELYIAHKDYQWMMDFSEKMIKHVVQKVHGNMVAQFGDYRIDFGKPFEQISMYDAIVKYAFIAQKDLTESTIDATLIHYNITLSTKHASWGEKIYAIFDELVESKLIQPTFITHFPVEVSPLAKRDPENSHFVSRFEMFVAGMEISNAFNELNDPFDQAERFHKQAEAKEAGDQEAHHYDADYVLALEYGLPPTVGFGLGIDRLAMLLTNTLSIKDVILFPTLKTK